MSLILSVVGVGVLLIVLAIALSVLVPASKVKVPAAVLSGFGGLGAGTALGIVAMAFYGDQWKLLGSQSDSVATPAASGGMGGGGMGGMGGGGMRGGGMGGGGMGGGGMGGGGMRGGGMGGGANSKNQLAALIVKLDVLTMSPSPLVVTLNDDQKSKVQAQLQGLDELSDLKEDDAKKRLDALLDVMKDQKPALEAAGYRWPGAGGGMRGGGGMGGGGMGGGGMGGGGMGGGGMRGGGAAKAASPPNPFREGSNGEHLKSLQVTLGPAPLAKTNAPKSKDKEQDKSKDKSEH